MYELFVNSFNTNPFVAGVVMIFMNLGSKHLANEIPNNMEKFFSNPYIRKITLFCILFVATKNLEISLILTLLFLLLSKYILNENSIYCSL
jgi:ABC-type uncharacterized transport system permease subunit